MKIIVTGGAGFIGSHLTDALVASGQRVIVIDNLATGRKENVNKKSKFYRLDIRSPKVEQIFKKEKPDAVFHLAAQMNVRRSLTDPIFDAQVNIIGSLNLLELSCKFKVRRFIFTSSGGAIYGDQAPLPTPENYPPQPLSPYGLAKLAIDNYLYYYQQIKKLSFVSLRLANVYGPRQETLGEAGVVAIFCYRLLRDQMVFINGTGRQTRDFVFVEDVIRALMVSLKSKRQGFYNIGTGRETSVNQLLTGLKKITGKKVKAMHRPAIIGELNRSTLQITKARQGLKWRPQFRLEEGLKKTYEWFQRNKL